MPNHWETSGGPLFVKTVFVNGNRHAILYQEDPLLRCGNSPCKKISRTNSLLSFSSDFSVSSSDSQDSNFDGKTLRPGAAAHRQHKDLSSELQSCLVGLKLASGKLDISNKPNQEKCLCNSKDLKRSQSKEKGNSKQKRHKTSNNEKSIRKKQREQFYNEPMESKSVENKYGQDNSCYVYNLENYKGKKKYCFVKISSQLPQFILNCCCEKNWNETHTRHRQDKTNLVISATIHNLVMRSDASENLMQKTFDYVFPFQNEELSWDNYLTKSYYNSLSDRVFQWLDLARKRKKQKEALDLKDEEESTNNCNHTERIFSGKTFVGEIKKTEFHSKQRDKLITKKIAQNEESEEAVGEVTGEPHVETLLSIEKNQKIIPESSMRESFWDSENTLKQQKLHEKENNFVVSPPANPSYKMQNFFLDFHTNDQSKIKTNDSHNQKLKIRGSENRKEEKYAVTPTTNTWETGVNRKSPFADNYDGDLKQCRYNRSLDETGDKIKYSIAPEEFAERNLKSINNPNITRTRPVLIQNLLSPQQPDKTCYLREEKIVWASEKNTGRPQLHIFMPSILLRDQSEDSTSECENFFNL